MRAASSRTARPGAWILSTLAAFGALWPGHAPAHASAAGRATPGGAPDRWLERIQAEITAREYEVTWQDRPVLEALGASWHAPNRAQGFRTYFAEDGIRVVPREEAKPSWVWSLGLVGYGRGAALWPVEEPSLSPWESRIDYGRRAVKEWFVNEPRGLKHGFLLDAPPREAAASIGVTAFGGRVATPGRDRGAGGKGLVHLDLAVGGSLRPVVTADGRAVDFVASGGAGVVRYAGLLVTDARGRVLPSWMEGVADEILRGVRLVVDDTNAVYPITIDPLAASPAWTAESDQDGARLGLSVGTAGDVNGDGCSDLIVGADLYDNGQADEGRTFVYAGSASGLSMVPLWTAEGDQAGASFGVSVGTAGDVNGDGYADVIVGAQRYDNGQADEGRAFVYHGSASGPSPAPAWAAEGGQAGAELGVSVGTAGDVDGDGYADVIVGAHGYDHLQPNEGRALVYLGSASGLFPSPVWTAQSNQSGANFGFSVGTAGDVDGDGYADVIVGAWDYGNGQAGEGRAFLYLGSATGPSPTPSWTAESDQAGAEFGISVSTAGDVNGDGYADVIVGAHLFDNGVENVGRAYAYLGSASGLSPAPSWTAESGQSGAVFGRSVGTAGDVNGDGYADVIVGAPLYDNGQANEGQVYVYLGSASGLSLSPTWTVDSDAGGGQGIPWFGISVGTAGDVNGDGYSDVLVGAYLYDNGQANEGRAYAYMGSASGLSLSPSWEAGGGVAGAQLGFSVGAAGDVNGDGYADVIVGALGYDNGQNDEGRALAYLGSATGLSLTPSWTAESDQPGANFGSSVGTAGDVNGDGYSDVIVGALGYDNVEFNEGAAFAYLGTLSGLSLSPSWTAESDQSGARFGTSVGTAGDVNGDGYADVIVGANLYANGQSSEGRAFVYAGSSSGLSPAPSWAAESDQSGARFGASVGTAGDVNGDGYADVIVGANLYDNGQLSEGGAFAYLGSAAGLAPQPAWITESDEAGSEFGISVGTAGDVNGDGYSDVIVGAYRYDNDQSSEGRAFVYLGSGPGLSLTPSWTTESNQDGAFLGRSVGTAGDINGDGYADVIVGAYHYDNGQNAEGRAYAYLGSATGLSPVPEWTMESNHAGAFFGFSVGTAGDVNGDGYADVIVGASQYDGASGGEGRAFVYYGNASEGLPVAPQQRRADDLAPIAHGGRSRSPGSFRLEALGRSPFGHTSVKLELEAKPRGELFDGTGTLVSAGWEKTGATGARLNELVSGLDPGAYHWRMRFLYDPVSSPFLQAGRWLTVPWNGWNETDLTVSPFIGGVVWEDLNEDGILDAAEPPLQGVAVELLDDLGSTVNQTATDSQGSYRFEVTEPGDFRVRFGVPVGYEITLQDQGADDLVDSDADPATGETALIVPPFQGADAAAWSAGLIQPCLPPDQPVEISGVRLDTGGLPVLDFHDLNDPSRVTGYDVYRSSDASLSPGTWPLVASDVTDGDPATPYIQWTDTSGDPSPSGIWYYQVTAYNSACSAEGPF